jgi:hypothetical protein
MATGAMARRHTTATTATSVPRAVRMCRTSTTQEFLHGTNGRLKLARSLMPCLASMRMITHIPSCRALEARTATVQGFRRFVLPSTPALHGQWAKRKSASTPLLKRPCRWNGIGFAPRTSGMSRLCGSGTMLPSRHVEGSWRQRQHGLFVWHMRREEL